MAFTAETPQQQELYEWILCNWPDPAAIDAATLQGPSLIKIPLSGNQFVFIFYDKRLSIRELDIKPSRVWEIEKHFRAETETPATWDWRKQLVGDEIILVEQWDWYFDATYLKMLDDNAKADQELAIIAT